MGWQRYCHGWTPLAAFVRDHVWYVGCDRRETGWILWSVKCLRAAMCATILEIHFLRFGGSVQLCAEHRPGARRWVVTAPALVFSFLLLVYLKSAQIVSAGSPEVKPAEAHGSDSLLCAEVVLWPLAHVIPSFSSIFPVIVTSRLAFPMGSTLCYPSWWFILPAQKGSFIIQRNDSRFSRHKCTSGGKIPLLVSLPQFCRDTRFVFQERKSLFKS